VSLRETDRENLEFYLTRHADSSLRVLSGTLRPEQSELVTDEHARAAVEIARKHFLHVIVELPRNFSEVNLAAIESTHNLLVVSTPDGSGLRGAAESQRLFRELFQGHGEPTLFVMNHPSPYTAVPVDAFEQRLGVPLVADIPFGGDPVSRAALEGQPLVLRTPGSATSKAINRLADLLEQQLAEARALSPATFASVP
jgi:MinD-like ATPase involved in chromosome partitioning or flagellar assembly